MIDGILMLQSDVDYGTFGLDFESDELAKTVFGFMIKNVFSPFKEIISMQRQ